MIRVCLYSRDGSAVIGIRGSVEITCTGISNQSIRFLAEERDISLPLGRLAFLVRSRYNWAFD